MENEQSTKVCRFCKKEVAKDAIKCPYCRSTLGTTQGVKIAAWLFGLFFIFSILAGIIEDTGSGKSATNTGDVPYQEEIKDTQQNSSNVVTEKTNNALVGTIKTTPTKASTSVDYNDYQNLAFDVFSSAASSYVGEAVAVVGMKSDFISSGNYLVISNPYNSTNPSIALKITNATYYQQAVKALNGRTYPFVKAYGIGQSSEEFTSTNTFRQATIQIPVIKVTRLDLCTDNPLTTTGTCTAVEIFPSQGSLPSTTTYTQEETSVSSSNQTSTATATTPATDDKTIGETYYKTHNSCVGLYDQEQYGACLNYAYNN